jgi:hypothetical protein
MSVYSDFLITATGTLAAVSQLAERLKPTITKSDDRYYAYDWNIEALFSDFRPYVLLLGSNFFAPDWPPGGSPCGMQDSHSFSAADAARFERVLAVVQRLGIERDLHEHPPGRRWFKWLEARECEGDPPEHRFALSLAGLSAWGSPDAVVERLSVEYPTVAFVLECLTNFHHYEICSYRKGRGQLITESWFGEGLREDVVRDGIVLDPREFCEEDFWHIN